MKRYILLLLALPLLAQNPPASAIGVSQTQVQNGTDGYCLYIHNGKLENQVCGGGGGSTPGSPSGSLQFNNAGSFGGITGSTWNGTTLTFAGNGTPGNVIAHFGPSSVGNNTFEFLATNDFLNNSSGMFVNSSSNDAGAGSFTSFFAFADNINPTGEMGGVTAGRFNVIHEGAGTLDTATGISVGMFLGGTPGVVTDAIGISVSNVAIATNNWAIKTGAGKVEFDDLKTTGAATGKKVVCVDTATGILYASSASNSCAN